MGLLDFGAVAEGGVKGPYTDYDTALTALRADAGANDGDAYQLDSGQLFAAYTSEGPGILIPSDLYPQIDAYVSNATGIAHQTTADTQADLVARGWTTTTRGSGTITGGDGSPFRLDTVTGNATGASIVFLPTTNATHSLMLIKIQPISGTSTAITRLRIYTGTHYFQISCTDGVLGQFDTYQFATNGPVPETLGQFTDTTAQWYLMLYNNTNTNSVAYWTRIDGPPEERISAEVSNLKTSTSSSQVNIAVDRGSVGSQGSFDLYETHALVLT